MITVRHYMIDAGWGQAELARALGVNYSYVSLLLRGKRKPSLEMLRKLNEVTGIDMGTLVGEAGKKPPKRKPVPKVNGSA